MQFACLATDDFYCSRIDHMIDLRHPLAVLAWRMPWQEIEARVAQVFSRKGRAGVAMPDLDLFGKQAQRKVVASSAGRPRVPLRIMIKRVLEGKCNFGLNASNDTYGDMIEMGILDATKVTRTALQNAASGRRRC